MLHDAIPTACGPHRRRWPRLPRPQVFVWQDEGEGEVTQYRTFEGHRADVLSMAASHKRGLLATGEGRGAGRAAACCWQRGTSWLGVLATGEGKGRARAKACLRRGAQL